MDEVRFDRMVPSEVVVRRAARNLAYLPVGSLEWHGPHMPFGTDYMTVTYLAEQAARCFGGVVFPPVYYGDVRYILQECRIEWRRSYQEDMQVPASAPATFSLQAEDGSPGYDCPTVPDDGPPAPHPLPFDKAAMEQRFAESLAAILVSIHLYGFRNIILLPGHGPNPTYCRMAQEVYADNVRRRSSLGEPARTLSWFYLEAAKEFEPWLQQFWIHADKWEGALTMVAAPGTVKPELLPEDRQQLAPAYLGHPYLHEDTGYSEEYAHLREGFDALDPRNDTNEEYGREQWEGIIGRFGEVIAQWLGEVEQ
ncbi:MAG: creatininase family protein [Armatimonadetes bacterium]|nr:creatininase family protein [Armatimonadota bacterium]